MKSIKERLTSFVKGDKKVKIIMLLGIAGMLFILGSEFLPAKGGSDEKNTSGKVALTSDEYCSELEARLTKIVSSIEGAGACEVMVTLENAGEKIYMTDGSNSNERTEENDEGKQKISEKYSSDSEVVIIDDGGDENGLLAKEIEPTVRGVVVVCQGGGSAVVNQRIVNAITTALNISSARVFVTELGSNTNNNN